ncbi:MAG: hypothetical protein FWD16_03250 [Clostridia bacterium]|nr:hypothetical protein [Clostridia bacterium]
MNPYLALLCCRRFCIKAQRGSPRKHIPVLPAPLITEKPAEALSEPPENLPELPAPIPPPPPPEQAVEPEPNGLLHYEKWWFQQKAALLIGDELIEGTPVFLRDNTLRVINDSHSYFIPLEHIKFIRTCNGLDEA